MGEPNEPSKPKKRRVPPQVLLPFLLLVGFGANRGYRAWVAHAPLDVGGAAEVRTIQAR